MYAEVISD